MLTVKYNFKCKAKDLQVGDVIKTSIISPHPWDTGIVKNIDVQSIHIFRPYGTTTDFTHTGGVICYIGIEQYTIAKDECEFFVFQRQELK